MERAGAAAVAGLGLCTLSCAWTLFLRQVLQGPAV
jgi:hypothetical protein